MTLIGGCSICSAPALNACSLCGKLVCRNHYDSETGLCFYCLRKTGGIEEIDESDVLEDEDF